MADIRIKDLATTATTTASDDFMAVDGATNGTRKLSAATPAFLTSVTTPSLTSPAASPLTLGLGTGGTALTLASSTLAATFASTTAATNTTSGALQVAGGVGVAGAVIAGGTNNGTNEYSYPFLSSATTLGGFATYSSGATTNQRVWAIQHGSGVGDGVWRLRALNDALSNGSNAISITRTAEAIGTISLGTTTAIVSVLGTTAGSSNAGALVVAGGISAGQSAQASWFGGNLTVASAGTSTFGSGTNREPLSITSASTTDTIFHIINTSTNGVDWQLRSVGNAGSAGGVAGDLVFFCGGPFNASALKFNGTTGAATFGGAVTVGGGRVTSSSTADIRNFVATGNLTEVGYQWANTGTGAKTWTAWSTANSSGLAANGSWILRNETDGVTALSFASTGAATFAGAVTTSAPTGGAGAWELGIANTVTPTSPNRTITIEIGGAVYYLAAKTTND